MLLVTVGALIFKKQSQLSFKTLSSVFLCLSEIFSYENVLIQDTWIRKEIEEMSMFLDTAKISVKAGRGGDRMVAFPS